MTNLLINHLYFNSFGTSFNSLPPLKYVIKSSELIKFHNVIKPVTKAHHLISKAPINNNIGKKPTITNKKVISFTPISIANTEKINEYGKIRENKSIKFLFNSIPNEESSIVTHFKITTKKNRWTILLIVNASLWLSFLLSSLWLYDDRKYEIAITVIIKYSIFSMIELLVIWDGLIINRNIPAANNIRHPKILWSSSVIKFFIFPPPTHSSASHTSNHHSDCLGHLYGPGCELQG